MKINLRSSILSRLHSLLNVNHQVQHHAKVLSWSGDQGSGIHFGSCLPQHLTDMNLFHPTTYTYVCLQNPSVISIRYTLETLNLFSVSNPCIFSIFPDVIEVNSSTVIFQLTNFLLNFAQYFNTSCLESAVGFLFV